MLYEDFIIGTSKAQLISYMLTQITYRSYNDLHGILEMYMKYSNNYDIEPWWISGPALKREQERKMEMQRIVAEAQRNAISPLARVVDDFVKFLRKTRA